MQEKITYRFFLAAALAGFVLLCAPLSPVFAQQRNSEPTFEDGQAAYDSGEMEEAAKIFWRLAGTNDAEAQYYLATLMDAGTGTPKDVFGALNWFRKSAEQDYLPAVLYMGYAFSAGHGVTKDEQKAFEWYQKAGQMGDAAAQNNLGVMLRDGRGHAADLKMAAQWFLQSAMQGSARAQYNLATMYLTGRGIKLNEAEAVRWYTAAAKQGDAYAENTLGALYRFGRGVGRNPAKAVAWYLRAAKQGHVASQLALAAMHESGEAGGKGPEEALSWYARAAAAGDVQAQYRLAYFYETGTGLRRDLEQAVRWYKKVAEEQNYKPALGALCRLYAGESSIRPNIDAAVALYKKGAGAGEPYCQFGLGRSYQAGTGVPQDLVEAYQWLALAAQNLPEGEDKAGAVVTRIEISNALSETQLGDARKRVSSWKPADAADK